MDRWKCTKKGIGKVMKRRLKMQGKKKKLFVYKGMKKTRNETNERR